MKVLITGATGQVGGEAARTLAGFGVELRVLVRDPTKMAWLDGVEVVRGHFEDDAALRLAMDGVDSVLLVGRDSPDMATQQLRVLEHVALSGAKHVVKLSAIGARADSPVELMRDHHAVDNKLREGPAAWTLLKPHLFMQNLLRAAEMVREENRLLAPMGDVLVPLVDTRDVGVAAAVILSNPTAHVGKTYHLTGPERYSYRDVAAVLSAMVGRFVTYEAVSPSDFEARLISSGIPEWRAFDLAHIALAYSPEDNVVSSDFDVLVGRHPIALPAFLREHREIFGANQGRAGVASKSGAVE